MNAEYAIEVRGLLKIFKGELGQKDVTALSSLELNIEAGQVFAFIGPNGAGKTTTIKLLARLIFPTTGSIRIFGRENSSPEAMRKTGYLPEQPGVYGYLTGKEFLDYIGRLFHVPATLRKKRRDMLLDTVGIAYAADTLVRNYSRGMVQRLALAQALINDPQLLILDEPMANLDPVGRKDFRDLILRLKDEGKTIFFSSHILSDAETIADQVGIINRGELMSSGGMENLLSLQSPEVEIAFILPEDKIPGLSLPENFSTGAGGRVRVSVEQNNVKETLGNIEAWGGSLVSIVPGSRTLEAVFLDKIGR